MEALWKRQSPWEEGKQPRGMGDGEMLKFQSQTLRSGTVLQAWIRALDFILSKCDGLPRVLLFALVA